MSLLLDALNKADQERKRNEATPGINSNHGHTGEHNPRTLSVAVITAAFVGIAILLAVIYWLGQRSSTAAEIADKAVSATLTAPTNATNSTKSTANPTKSTASQAVNKDLPTSTTQTPIAPAQEIQKTEQDVANLYAQNTQLITPETPVPTTETVPASNSDSAEVSPATPTSITQFANLPDLHDLPSQVLIKIPSLNYSEHNYNNVSGSVKINSTIHHANDQLAPGLVIDKILVDGMILHLDNYAFKMRALNSWVNM